MITALGTSARGKPLVLCGLARENIERLVKGEPILVPAKRLKEMGMRQPVEIVITFAEDQATLVGWLEGELGAEAKSS